MRNGFYQGALDEKDLNCIMSMAEVCPETEQILVTGEIAADQLSEDGLISLCNWNNIAEDTLFLLSDRQTVVMTRYDPQIIWNSIPPIRRVELFIAECLRFGVKHWSMQWPDFYEGVFEVNKMFGKYVILDNWQDTAYVNAVLLLHKSCTFGIRMSQFFSVFSFKNVELRNLTEKQETELHEVQTMKKNHLTNDELSFLSDLFLKEKTNQKIIRFPA